MRVPTICSAAHSFQTHSLSAISPRQQYQLNSTHLPFPPNCEGALHGDFLTSVLSCAIFVFGLLISITEAKSSHVRFSAIRTASKPPITHLRYQPLHKTSCMPAVSTHYVRQRLVSNADFHPAVAALFAGSKWAPYCFFDVDVECRYLHAFWGWS